MASTYCTDGVLVALQSQLGWVSLHTGDPGDGGLNEVNSPFYSRQAVLWGTPAGGVMTNSVLIQIPLPAGVAVYYLGLWDAAVDGGYQDAQLIQTSMGVGVILQQAGMVSIPVGALIATVGSSS